MIMDKDKQELPIEIYRNILTGTL